jgi:hypothetical protein
MPVVELLQRVAAEVGYRALLETCDLLGESDDEPEREEDRLGWDMLAHMAFDKPAGGWGAVADADAAEEEEEKGRRRWWRWCNWWTKSLLLTRSLTVSLPPSLLPPCPPLLALRRRACNGAGAAP